MWASQSPQREKGLARDNIIRELVETEKKYVGDLEIMQKYANALSRSRLLDEDTLHRLFSNLTPILNFQRKFLVGLEGTVDLPWQEQRWGRHFLRAEEEFAAVYEPFCANHADLSELCDLVAEKEHNIPIFNHLATSYDLRAFPNRPVGRVCKYPLLLDSLLKTSKAATYPYHAELHHASAAMKRVVARVSAAHLRAENTRTTTSLLTRVVDWKGHDPADFGALLLDDAFRVSRADCVVLEYLVFLFERIVLCCTDADATARKGKSRLHLQGHIFLRDVLRTEALPRMCMIPPSLRCILTPEPRTAPAGESGHPLAVWWDGDDGVEALTLRCRTEEQRGQWAAQIGRLIREGVDGSASHAPP
ncbi:Dbl homology domain-containing protein [Mycena vulgaris]|nr:Dbl homology domain-containing protein [Mycena vulgaris]